MRIRTGIVHIMLMAALQVSGLNVRIEEVINAPDGPYGHVFSHDDWLEYMENGVLLYLGCYPPNLYTVKGDQYLRLIDHYENPFYETQNPNRVVTQLIRSRVKGEFLYFARTSGADQESYRILARPEGGVAVELVSKEYWIKNVDRMTPADYSLKEGYFLDLQKSDLGDLNPAIKNPKSGSTFVLNSSFRMGNLLHFGRIAVSPDKSHIAMIVTYRPKETDVWTDRLVILDLEYGDSSANGKN
jgi:hypothetical protein